MVTIFEMLEDVKALLVSKTDYLQVPANKINIGVTGEDEKEVFSFKGQFIRLYAIPKPAQDEYHAALVDGNKASFVIVCGVKMRKSVLDAQKSFELAERIDRLIKKRNILNRETSPIFPVKGSEGVSVFAIPFWFQYKSSAGDPDA